MLHDHILPYTSSSVKNWEYFSSILSTFDSIPCFWSNSVWYFYFSSFFYWFTSFQSHH